MQKGEQAYAGADYDIADAHFLLGRVMKRGGAAEAALEKINEAYRRFQLLADQGNTSAAGMAAKSLGEKGECLILLGRLDEAATTYQENMWQNILINNI